MASSKSWKERYPNSFVIALWFKEEEWKKVKPFIEKVMGITVEKAEEIGVRKGAFVKKALLKLAEKGEKDEP